MIKLVLAPAKARVVVTQPHKKEVVIKQLRKSLRVRVDGYQHIEAYQEHRWDGYSHNITETGSYLTGLTRYVYRLLVDRYGERSVVILPASLPQHVTRSSYFVNKVGNGWELLDHQVPALKAILNYTYPDGTPCYQGVLKGAVNSGKTALFSALILNYPGCRSLIICSRTLLFQQTVKFFLKIHGEDDVGVIQGNNVKFGKVTIAMVQSLHGMVKRKRRLKKLSTYFDLVLVDECHNLSNDRGIKVLKLLQAPIRYGFSGTPYGQGKKTAKATMLGLLGGIIYNIQNKDMQEQGISLQGIVKVHRIDYPVMGTSRDYSNYLCISKARNERIAEIVRASRPKKVLVIFRFIEHLLEASKYVDDIPNLYVTHGEDDNSKYVLDQFKRDPSGVMYATQIVQEGLNIPDLQVGVIAFGGEDEIAIKQCAGRFIRLDGVSTEVVIHDFMDTGKNLWKHSQKRLKYYAEEGYIIKKLYEESS